jgi:hypothetical protein
MRGLGFLVLIAALALPALAPAASDDKVSIELIGGEVVGPDRGTGTASVVARVENLGEKPLTGMRIAVFYATADVPPPPNAQWYIHEFVFEPPLVPGGTSTLRFKDEKAGEYILIEARRLLYATGLTYNGKSAVLNFPLLDRNGVTYVSTRDLVDLVGGGISYDAATGFVIVERKGRAVKVKTGVDYALVGDTKMPLKNAPIEEDHRSYLPVADIAPLLGLNALSETPGSYQLSDR